MNASPFLRACHRQPVEYTPVWLMRQAGRILPEYRAIRERFSFLDLSKTPEAAAEVTVLPVDRLKVDAAIIFADILLVIEPFGVGLEYAVGEGPIVHRPVRTAADVERLPDVDPQDGVPFVFEGIRRARQALDGRVPLIGFAGGPFTVASYLIEGGASQQFVRTKQLMHGAPSTWHRLMEKLTRLTVRYLSGQVAAGAEAVQIFDSWVGCLAPDDYRRHVLPYTRRIIEGIARDHGGVPVIHFGTGTFHLLALQREAGGDIIGIDWRVGLDEGWRAAGEGVAVQGNLDPATLLGTRERLLARVDDVLARAGGRAGHIFNLGHGILPATPVENVKAVVDHVHARTAR